MPSAPILTKLRFHGPTGGAIVALALLSACSHTTVQSSTRTKPSAGITAQAPLRLPAMVDIAYRAAAEQAVAAQLRLTPSAISRQLRAEPGSTLLTFVKPLGFAQDQLTFAILTGLDASTDQTLHAGRLTPDQAAFLRQYWRNLSAASLISEISSWYLP